MNNHFISLASDCLSKFQSSSTLGFNNISLITALQASCSTSIAVQFQSNELLTALLISSALTHAFNSLFLICSSNSLVISVSLYNLSVQCVQLSAKVNTSSCVNGAFHNDAFSLLIAFTLSLNILAYCFANIILYATQSHPVKLLILTAPCISSKLFLKFINADLSHSITNFQSCTLILSQAFFIIEVNATCSELSFRYSLLTSFSTHSHLYGSQVFIMSSTWVFSNTCDTSCFFFHILCIIVSILSIILSFSVLEKPSTVSIFLSLDNNTSVLITSSLNIFFQVSCHSLT